MYTQYPHNPILDSHLFIPDVEAHVWEDGRMYLYGSFDIQGSREFCSDVYHVYSSDDLVHWVDHGQAFSLADTAWAKDCRALYAPDCAYRDGWYYLYYCVPDGRCGVAKSQSPIGPFQDVGQMEGVWGIDPAVLIDDDGQAYLYWGQVTWGKVAKLKDNMVEIEQASAVTPLSVDEHEFHEGSSVKKIGNKYYFLFADTHRHGDTHRNDGRPSSLGYAISDHPMHGFKYGGVIIDNWNCDPHVWNNHGSMVCFKNQWYVVYHRSTHGSENSRHVCMEKIYFDAEGHIPEVIQTSSGVGEYLPANMVIPAYLACDLRGNVRKSGRFEDDTNLLLTHIHHGDAATYRYLGFNGEDVFAITMKTQDVCRVELYIDGMYHGEMKVPAQEQIQTYACQMAPIDGKHTLTLYFYGDLQDAVVKEFVFKKN